MYRDNVMLECAYDAIARFKPELDSRSLEQRLEECQPSMADFTRARRHTFSRVCEKL
jgi:hypothetical protein